MPSATAVPTATATSPAPAATVLPPAVLLRLEGAGVLAGAVIAYAWIDASWWMFGALLLVPDVGLLGYLAGLRVGATTYNLTHTAIFPLLLGTVALATASPAPGAVALIWMAHIGMDRALGYGLKYPTSFRHTHLQRAVR